MRTELALLSQECSLSVDPEGHYIDIVGRPQMPTTTELAAGDELKPCYEEVNVATIYLNRITSYATTRSSKSWRRGGSNT